MGDDEAHAKLAIREDLLDAIAGHIRGRDPELSKLVARITAPVRANGDRMEGSGLAADVEASGAMSLGRGKMKPSTSPLREARMAVDTISVVLRMFTEQKPAAPQLS